MIKKTKYVQIRRKVGVSLLVAVSDTVAYAREHDFLLYEFDNYYILEYQAQLRVTVNCQPHDYIKQLF